MRKLIIIVAVYSFFSCFNGQDKKGAKNIDPFYKSRGSYDAIRIPLVKPYELVKLNGDSSWNLNLLESPGSVARIKGVFIKEHLIFLQAGDSYCNNELVKESWTIINVLDKSERCFNDQKSFEDESHGHINFKVPDLVYKEFSETGDIFW